MVRKLPPLSNNIEETISIICDKEFEMIAIISEKPADSLDKFLMVILFLFLVFKQNGPQSVSVSYITYIVVLSYHVLSYHVLRTQLAQQEHKVMSSAVFFIGFLISLL